MATNAVQLTVLLIDGMQIAAIALVWHAPVNHAVCKRYEVNSEEFRATLHLSGLSVRGTGLRGIAGLEQLQQRSAELWWGCIANEVPFTEGHRKVNFRHRGCCSETFCRLWSWRASRREERWEISLRAV
jgi:hypothetical protein